MHHRITKALAAGTFLTLPLLAACGATTAPAGGSAAPAGAPSTSAAAASPTPSSTPVDETENVRAAATTLVIALFGVRSSESYAEYRDRLKPLLTKEGYRDFEASNLEQTFPAFAKRYGRQARSTTKVSATPEVEKLTAGTATVTVTYVNRIQQRSDGTWRTVKTSPEDTIKLPLVKQDGRWLVDDLD